MSYRLAILAIGIAAMASVDANPAFARARFGEAGQGVVMQRNLSLDLAKTIAEAAQAECKGKGFHTLEDIRLYTDRVVVQGTQKS